MKKGLENMGQRLQSPPPPSKAPQASVAAGVVTMAWPPPPPVVLGLELGLGPGKSPFTLLQVQELEHQALIFKYMAAGVPVPFHLVLPIWKSVAGSSYHHHCPTSPVLGCGSLWFDCNRNNMEPDPGRCRRTDGKKWRCSKDVVSDQKYCERHMHRGRNRSRKPVEATATAAAAASSTQVSISTGLQLTNSNYTSISPPPVFSPTSVLLGTGTCNTGPS